VAPSNVLILFLVFNKRRFLFSSVEVTFNETLIEILNAYFNACLNETPHEESQCDFTSFTIAHHIPTFFYYKNLPLKGGIPILAKILGQCWFKRLRSSMVMRKIYLQETVHVHMNMAENYFSN